MLIDTHAHLFLEEFSEDIDDVINRATKNNIKKIILPNVDSSTIDPLLDCCNKFPNICYPAIGIHPTSIKENYQEELDFFYKIIDNKKFIAIGEIGIDLYWEKKYLNEQILALKRQIEISIDLNLPIILHVRESFKETFEILNLFDNKKVKGVFHAFTGNLEEASYILSNYPNFKFGIGGILTFKNSNLKEVVTKIPENKIVIETDSPYLAPVPKRGKRNESSFLIYIAQYLSKIKNIDFQKICEITTNNALELFNFFK